MQHGLYFLPPRAAMSDNGAAMTATEITEGLARLGILHQTTQPYSPYQNGKQEILWGSVEGRLIAMLEGIDDLSLARLNEATQAWVEQDYNRKHHSEMPITIGYFEAAGFDDGGAIALAQAAPFGAGEGQPQRRGIRAGSRHGGAGEEAGERCVIDLPVLEVRFAAWDLTQVHLVDPQTGTVLCRLFPVGQGRQRLRPTAQPAADHPRATP
jgi:putative transposase